MRFRYLVVVWGQLRVITLTMCQYNYICFKHKEQVYARFKFKVVMLTYFQ